MPACRFVRLDSINGLVKCRGFTRIQINPFFVHWRIVMFLKRQPKSLLAVPGYESQILTLALGLAILLATAMSVAAQTTSGSITGNVVDAQRAAIANATVT